MQAAIDYLQNQLQVLETNAPINEREGHLAQAALERDSAAQIRDALTLLLNAKHLSQTFQPQPQEKAESPCTGS